MKRATIAVFGLVLFWALGLTVVLFAAAPTLGSAVVSTCNDADGDETTASASWTSGDFVVAQGVTEDNGITLTTPATSGSGVTLSAVASTPTNTASTAKSYAWTATASATSSGTFTATCSGTGSCCLAVWVFSGSDGLGNTAINANTGTTSTVSLTRGSANSFVTWMAGDWNAVSDTATDPSPAGGNQRVGDNSGFVSGRVTNYANDWGDQGATGTTSYGISAHAGGGQFSQIALEIKGTGAAPAAPKRLLTLGAGE